MYVYAITIFIGCDALKNTVWLSKMLGRLFQIFLEWNFSRLSIAESLQADLLYSTFQVHWLQIPGNTFY